jgi:hypothetical protein
MNPEVNLALAISLTIADMKPGDTMDLDQTKRPLAKKNSRSNESRKRLSQKKRRSQPRYADMLHTIHIISELLGLNKRTLGDPAIIQRSTDGQQGLLCNNHFSLLTYVATPCFKYLFAKIESR